jgi:hypothetical protein
VLGAVGDFVIDVFDFAGEMKVLRILGVAFEEGVPLLFKVVAFLLPETGNCHHGVDLRTSVRSFVVGG